MKININNLTDKISNNINLKAADSYKNIINKEICSLGIEINSRAEFPYNLLSNFSPTSFSLDGVQINSMEGFLQSLKIKDIEFQKKVCLMPGLKAKGLGKKLNKKRGFDFKHLYWQGKPLSRVSQEYTDLLERAYKERFNADENFRFALEYSENRILKHSIGSKDKTRSLLTEEEFICILTKLRASLKNN